MKDELLIVGDIAGNFNALERLISQIPNDIFVLAVGDVINKGPDSKKVLRFFKENKKCRMLLGNHEYLMLRSLKELSAGKPMHRLHWTHLWIQSKGLATIESFLEENISEKMPLKEILHEFHDCAIQDEYIEFLLSCPTAFHQPGLLVSHSPYSLKWLPKLLKQKNLSEQSVWLGIHPFTRKATLQYGKQSLALNGSISEKFPEILFSRDQPTPVKNYTHVFGHMSRWGFRKFNESQGSSYKNLCIDTSRKNILTGIFWPSTHVISTKI